MAESPALTTALKAFTTLTREQRGAFSRTLDGFVDCLASQAHPNAIARKVMDVKTWHDRANWDEEYWLNWETWGWYRHFCRNVSVVYTLLSISVVDNQLDWSPVRSLSSQLR